MKKKKKNPSEQYDNESPHERTNNFNRPFYPKKKKKSIIELAI